MSIKGDFQLIFRVYMEDGKPSSEVLESGAGGSGFSMVPKGSEGSRSDSEVLSDYFQEGYVGEDLAKEFADDFEKNVGEPLKEDDDRYFEMVGDISVEFTQDYWGEWDDEYQVENDRWQEVDKEEYDDKWGDARPRMITLDQLAQEEVEKLSQ